MPRKFGEIFRRFSSFNFQGKWAQKISRKILDIFHSAPNKVFFTAATLGAGGHKENGEIRHGIASSDASRRYGMPSDILFSATRKPSQNVEQVKVSSSNSRDLLFCRNTSTSFSFATIFCARSILHFKYVVIESIAILDMKTSLFCCLMFFSLTNKKEKFPDKYSGCCNDNLNHRHVDWMGCLNIGRSEWCHFWQEMGMEERKPISTMSWWPL